MTVFIVFAIILISLILLFFIISYICYRMAFGYSKKLDMSPMTLPNEEQYKDLFPKMKECINSALEIPYEEVSTKSFDGLTLFGRYYETAKGAPVQLMFHGYRSNSIRDFSGGLNFYKGLGLNVLIVDQRAHGKSKARSIAFGVLERCDCASWVDYIIKRNGKDTKIVLTGLSMGAATVLMASDLNLPENVKGILADCGYSSPKEIIKKVIRDMHFPTLPAYFLVRMGGIIYGGFDIEKSSAEKSVATTNIPILFVHGEDDKFVPVEMSIKNHNACKSKSKLLTVKGAAHGVSYLVDTKAYKAAVKDFFEDIGVI